MAGVLRSGASAKETIFGSFMFFFIDKILFRWTMLLFVDKYSVVPA